MFGIVNVFAVIIIIAYSELKSNTFGRTTGQRHGKERQQCLLLIDGWQKILHF